MKILILVPDGVGIRNYLYSSFVDELENKGYEVMLYHKVSESAIREIKNSKKNIKIISKIPHYEESLKVRILRESLAFARILRNVKILNNPTILYFWAKKPRTLKQFVLFNTFETCGWIFSKSDVLLMYADRMFERLILKSSVVNKIREDFSNLKPDLILNLHQRSPETSPIISLANNLKIPTNTVIFSWDNVPKGRLISRYDKYFVWSTLMKNELLLLYPEINTNSIVVVGTPQFEFYFKDKYKLEKNIFFNKYGLDPLKKTLCFSSNDLSSPYEVNYLEDICEEISKLPKNLRPQILFRKCPVDKSGRFLEVVKKYNNLIYSIDPDWRVEKSGEESFTSIYPAYNDIILLVNTVLHSDLVINLGSTMAHDFASVNKPCLYLNYDPVINSNFKVSDIYKFEHFKSMANLEAVLWINSKDEIGVKVISALENPQEIALDRAIWMKKIVEYPLENNSRLLIDALNL